MALTPDQIIDRINLKRQAVNWRFIAIVCLLLLALSLFTGKEFRRVAVIDGECVARVRINGEIHDDLNRIDNLKIIAESKLIKGLIIHINSAGGTPVGGENIYMAIRKISQTKPVAVVMGDAAASAAYMVAIAGDFVVAHDTTLTGSIGAIAQSLDVVDLADKIGVKFHNFKSSPLKGGPLLTEHLTPEMQKSMDSLVHDIYNSFIDLVSKRRNIDMQDLLPIADGRAYTGRQAFKLRLIDAIGDEDTAFNWVVENKKLNPYIKIRDYELTPTQSKLDKLLETSSNISQILKTIFNNKLT
jgi:protease-4